MSKIYIIGLGPGDINDLTLAAVDKINDNNRNFLRTEKHPTINFFLDRDIFFESFDYMYEEEEDFESVYEKISNELVKKAKEYGTINYFVPGNPMVAEKTVEILLNKDIDIEIISGISFIEPILEVVGRDPIDGLKIVDGSNFNNLMIDINTDMVITQVYNERILSEIKLILSEIYGDEYNIMLIHGAGIEDEEKVYNIPIYLVDRTVDASYLTSIYVPRMEREDRKIFDFNDTIEIMRILRGEDGCTWDMMQNHKSIRESLIEEAYEVVDAIDTGDIDALIEELGDLLLQFIFHSEIGYDQGNFHMIEVTSALANKLIYRHPHIFMQKKVENSEEVVYNWNKLKDEQRGLRYTWEKMEDISGLPALMKAFKIQQRGAEVGFDWGEIQGVYDKILEEYEEIKEAVDSPKKDRDKIEDELGDLIFTVVNLARFLKVNPEVALNRANNKFINRFKKMEEEAKKSNKSLKDMDLQEMNNLWDLAKKN